MEPAAVSPTAIFRAVMLYAAAGADAPVTASTRPVATSLHTVASNAPDMTGWGFTVITTVRGVPGQPDPLVGVMVYVAVIDALEVFVSTSIMWIVPAGPPVTGPGEADPWTEASDITGAGQVNVVPAGNVSGFSKIS